MVEARMPPEEQRVGLDDEGKARLLKMIRDSKAKEKEAAENG